MIALYPGSFDPITYGHLDIIERASLMFDELVVAILNNPQKQPTFDAVQRQQQIELAIAHLTNTRVTHFPGLTVDCARQHKAQVIIRGLRVLSDFEHELQMAHTNKTLAAEIETIFLATSNEYSFLSSSAVREIARLGGPIAHLVPTHVITDLKAIWA